MLGVTGAWGAGYTRTLTDGLAVPGYTAKAFYDFQTNTPAVLPTEGDFRYREFEKGGYWGLHNFGSGQRSAVVTIPVSEGDILVIQEYDASIVTSINRGTENVSLTSSTGYRVFDITATADDVTFTAARYAGIVAAFVMEKVNEEVDAVSAPYTADFAVEGEFDKFTVIDANGDDSTWELYEQAYASYKWSDYNAADDYLVLPISLNAKTNYKVTVNAAAMGSWNPEKFEVLVGKAATKEGLTTVVIPETVLTSAAYADFEGDFTTDEEGVWYVAIHATSDAGQYRLMVKSLKVELGAEGTAPAAATLAVEPGAEGALSATGLLTAPKTSVNGEALTENLEKIDVLCDGALLTTLYDIAPGAVKSFLDYPQTRGFHTYQVIPYNASGAGLKSEKVTVWIGADMPADVENVKITAMTDNTVTLAWDAVKGANGYYMNTENVKYTVVELEKIWNGQFNPVSEVVTVDGELTATIECPVEEGEQAVKFYGVKAVVDTDSSDPTNSTVNVFVGAPYDIPVTETFSGNEYDLFWLMSSNGDWNYAGENELALISNDADKSIVTFESGKLNLKPTTKATVMFDAKKGSSAVDKIAVYAIAPDGATTDIETITLADEYQTYLVTIPASLKEERYGRVGFKVDFKGEWYETVFLDNIKFIDLLANDLSIAIAAPKSLEVGNKATITATVKNEGENTAASYTVTIMAGEEELLNETVSEALESFATATFTAELETSIFDDAADVTITATVTFEGDNKEDNNTAEATLSITEPVAPGVTSVSAWSNTDRVIVYWSAPDTELANISEFTEDFENGAGGWTFIDADADDQTWSWEEDEWGWTAHNGSRGYLSSKSWTDEPYAVDNWLVSPKAVLDGTFKFWANGAENFQVYVSTESATDVDTFEPVSELLSGAYDYAEFTVDLSAYAGQSGWIAIRHYDSYNWSLAIDDITYLVGDGVVEVKKYNIYLDGELATTAEANQMFATIEGVAAGQHTVAVSVVYANGKESKPVEAAVSVATGLDKISILTQPVDVYSLDGKLVRKQTTSLDGLKGVYIMNGKKVILK